MNLHDAILADSGGEPGILNEGLLESAVHAPVESAGGDDAYYRFFDKLAALGYRLAMNHGFQDGNKRTSQLTMEQTLAWQGYYLEAWTQDTRILVMSLLGASHLPQEGLRHALILGCGLDPANLNVE